MPTIRPASSAMSMFVRRDPSRVSTTVTPLRTTDPAALPAGDIVGSTIVITFRPYLF